MGSVSVIEPVIGLHAFAMFMTYPLLQQYVYRRFWEQLSGSANSSILNQSLCTNNHSNLSIIQTMQREMSHFLLQSELCFLLPCLISSLLLVSYSDWCGWKVAMMLPLLGDLLFTLAYFMVSRFTLNLGYLLGAALIMGLFGGPASLIASCFSYVADRCQEGLSNEKMVRMARLDMVLGVMSGVGSLCSGFFVRATGFSWPFLFSSGLHVLNLIYVLGMLDEPRMNPEQNYCPNSGSSESSDGPPALGQRQAMTRRLQGVYLLFAASTQRRNVVLLLMLSVFIFYKVSVLGGMSMFILYELNAPLCWNEVLIGYGSALSTLIHLSSCASVTLLSRWLCDAHITLLGLLSTAAGLCMATFAKTTLLMFLGALFACVAFVETLSMGVAFPVFSSIYAATVSWFSGFSFLLAACLILIPATLIGAVLWIGLGSSRLADEDDVGDNTSSEILLLPQWHDC